MRQVNPPRPPPTPVAGGLGRGGGAVTVLAVLGGESKGGRRQDAAVGWGRGGGAPAGAAGAGRASPLRRPGLPVVLLRVCSSPFTLSHLSCRERPVPAEPSLRGHVEAPSVGRRWCASPPGTGCCCCTERTAYGGAGGGSVRTLGVFCHVCLRAVMVIADDEQATRLNLAWLEVPS